MSAVGEQGRRASGGACDWRRQGRDGARGRSAHPRRRFGCDGRLRRHTPVVNYDGFLLTRDVEDDYLAMVQDVIERYYLGVTRYTTSSFMRAKLGTALAGRGAAPHIYETEREARENLAAMNNRA